MKKLNNLINKNSSIMILLGFFIYIIILIIIFNIDPIQLVKEIENNKYKIMSLVENNLEFHIVIFIWMTVNLLMVNWKTTIGPFQKLSNVFTASIVNICIIIINNTLYEIYSNDKIFSIWKYIGNKIKELIIWNIENKTLIGNCLNNILSTSEFTIIEIGLFLILILLIICILYIIKILKRDLVNKRNKDLEYADGYIILIILFIITIQIWIIYKDIDIYISQYNEVHIFKDIDILISQYIEEHKNIKK